MRAASAPGAVLLTLMTIIFSAAAKVPTIASVSTPMIIVTTALLLLARMVGKNSRR